jgi:hypothetical protein
MFLNFGFYHLQGDISQISIRRIDMFEIQFIEFFNLEGWEVISIFTSNWMITYDKKYLYNSVLVSRSNCSHNLKLSSIITV